LLSWRSGAFFVSIVLVFAIVQYVIDHLRGRSTDYLCLVGVPALLVTLLMIVPFWRGYSLWKLQLASVLLGVLAFLALSASSYFMTRWKIRRIFYPIVVVALAGIAVAILYLVDPSLFSLINDKLGLAFNPPEGGTAISEMRGLSLSTAWEYFGLAFFISLASLLTLLYVTLKEGAAGQEPAPGLERDNAGGSLWATALCLLFRR